MGYGMYGLNPPVVVQTACQRIDSSFKSGITHYQRVKSAGREGKPASGLYKLTEMCPVVYACADRDSTSTISETKGMEALA